MGCLYGASQSRTRQGNPDKGILRTTVSQTSESVEKPPMFYFSAVIPISTRPIQHLWKNLLYILY